CKDSPAARAAPHLLPALCSYNMPTECCFKHAQKPIRHIQNFYETPSDCSLPAVVIVAASGAEVCADPKKPWVKRAMKKLRRKK
uniref:Chemokine interleukin-8-like domain-containing protein n=1 Tax=Aquila chrysaetos chrysaetos TaxID=223781 RepID=A0A663EIP4_AQUCH